MQPHLRLHAHVRNATAAPSACAPDRAPPQPPQELGKVDAWLANASSNKQQRLRDQLAELDEGIGKLTEEQQQLVRARRAALGACMQGRT
jgi:hypothetical protein